MGSASCANKANLLVSSSDSLIGSSLPFLGETISDSALMGLPVIDFSLRFLSFFFWGQRKRFYLSENVRNVGELNLFDHGTWFAGHGKFFLNRRYPLGAWRSRLVFLFLFFLLFDRCVVVVLNCWRILKV